MSFLVSESVGSDRPAIFDTGRKAWVSYGELRSAVEAGALQLRQSRKALVAIATGSTAGDITAYLAALAAGHAVVLSDPTQTDAARARLLDAYSPDFVITGPSDASVTGNAKFKRVTSGICGLNAFRRNTEDKRDLHPALAVMLSTSGSTGSCKHVRLSFDNVQANADAIGAVLDLDEDSRALSNLPMHYAYGLSVINSHLAAGGSVVSHAFSMLEPEFWDLASATGARSVPGVPFHYELLRRIGTDRLKSSPIRTMTQAGGRLPTERALSTWQALDSLGGKFFVMYGQTEATARISTLRHEELPGRLDSVGRAIPGGSLAIQNVSAITHSGEISYSGPNVMLGYASSRDDLSVGDECNGQLSTGDLGFLDADGYLFVTGRQRRMIKIAGKRINLDEVEALADKFSPLAAVGRDDELSLFVEPSPAGPPSSRIVAELIGVQVAAVRIRILESLPRTSNGKVDYPVLQELI